MNEDKIIERIRRLLALAEDASSPNESMIAARRARSMMDKHQISKGDIERAVGNQFLETKAERTGTVRKRWLLNLWSASAMLNDCETCVTYSPYVFYKFRGFKSDAIVAKLTMDYFVQACDRACEKSESKGISEKNFFRLGFSGKVRYRCWEIRESRRDLKFSSGKSLVISKKDQIIAHFGDLNPIKETKMRIPSLDEQQAYAQGIEQGRKLSLEKQVGEEVSNRRMLA